MRDAGVRGVPKIWIVTVRINDGAGVDDEGPLLDHDAAAGAIDAHTGDAGDPGGHIAFLAEAGDRDRFLDESFDSCCAEVQVEGAAPWGLSMALHEGSEFVKGQPKDTNLDTYTPLRMGDVPELEIEFLPSTETPVGLGEPATTAVAPAIGNAIFAASGARVRHLPIRPEAVQQALVHRT
jgi:hypothetical protein